MNRRQKRKVNKLIWTLILLLIAGIGVFFGKDYIFGTSIPSVSGGEVQFHFIDVGQGDAALIRIGEDYDVLIDAGPGSSEDELKTYLDKLGVDDLEYVVFTHPDEDHIGGADVILENYRVNHVIRPDREVDTKVYQRTEELIAAEGCTEVDPTPGKVFQVGEVRFTILAPLSDSYGDNNNYSVVLRVDYGATSVLFTGDAEVDSEEEMISRYRLTGELDCDILKVGHHGSDTSSSRSFLELVTPDAAVISCGKDNKHGHPDPEIVTRFNAMNVPMIRTDESGTIIYTSTGGEPERLAA